jgi:hypothetical protein
LRKVIANLDSLLEGDGASGAGELPRRYPARRHRGG